MPTTPVTTYLEDPNPRQLALNEQGMEEAFIGRLDRIPAQELRDAAPLADR